MKRRILVVNVNWLGDVLFSTPLIRALRETYPDSFIACLVHPRCKDILEDNPNLNEIILYDEEGGDKGILGKMRLVNSLKKKRFDTAFILHKSFTKALLTYLAGIEERVGYPTKSRSIILTKCVVEKTKDLHKVEYFLNLARAVGIEPKNSHYEFFVKDDDRKYVKDLLENSGVTASDTVVVICPGGNWDPKRWPRENFAELSDALIARFGVKVVIAGAVKDSRLADEIRSMMNNAPIIVSGNTTLKQLGALMERADLVIANDTGPMHLGAAMKRKVIALFGPTSPKLTGPYGEGDHRAIFKQKTCEAPCYNFRCKENRCMSAITVEDVVKEVEAILPLIPDPGPRNPL